MPLVHFISGLMRMYSFVPSRPWQNLAAIRQLFDYLVTGGILPSNLGGRGKTPVLSGDEMRQLLESIDIGELIGLSRPRLDRLDGLQFLPCYVSVTRSIIARAAPKGR